MKKLFPKILIVLLLVLLAVSVVACNNNNQESQDPDAPVEYETATYTVKFVSNGMVDFSVFNLKDVEAGSFISAPKNSDGTPAIPTKTGYTFAYWSDDGKEAFDFLTTAVNSDLTLTAVYLPNEYIHTVDITAKLLPPTSEDGKYSVQTGVYQNGSMPAAAVLKSTYNSSAGSLAVPTTVDATDRFLFWYYIGEDGMPVKFSTTLASSGSTQTVSHLASYKFTKPLTLYAMWYSLQPKVTVEYKDSLSDTVYDSKEYAQTDYVLDTDAPDMREAKEGYEFERWYYIKKVDGQETKTEFNFDTLETGSNPTLPATAAGIESVFEEGTLTLYADWKPLVSIASVADFEQKLYDKMYGENTSDEEKEAIQKSVIRIAGTINFGTKEYKPLFDDEHKFTGEIDGGVYDADGNLTGSAKLTGGVFGDDNGASVFGNVAGTVKNLDFENIGLKFSVPKQAGKSFAAGAIATQNSGKIENCNVKFDDLTISIDGAKVEGNYLVDGLASVVFGGFVARNTGGEISDGRVDIYPNTILAESLIFGGVAAENTGKITNINGNVTVTDVKCVDNNTAADGLPYAKIGGIVGGNGGIIQSCRFTVQVDSAESKNAFDFGGAAATLSGGIVKTEVEVRLGTATTPVQVGGSVNIGGLTGKSEGYVQYSASHTTLNVSVQKDNDIVYIGGLVGNNYSTKSDYKSGDTSMGTILESYAEGDVKLASSSKARVYSGGLAGRNNKTNIAKSFAVVNVAVESEGETSMGKVIGEMPSSVTIKSAWYAKETELILNGEDIGGNEVGTKTDEANFADESFVIGTTSTIKLTSAIWEIDGGLPVLKTE